MEKPKNFVLTGRSGCGKGTQAKLLMTHFGKDNFFIFLPETFFELWQKEIRTPPKK